jgi:predicted SAM-dependent methyltransferase
MDLRSRIKSTIVDSRKIFRMFRRLDREALAAHYIRGHGIEIGALHNPLRVPRAAHVRYVDRMSRDDLRTHYPELVRKALVHVDIIDDGERLATVGDASQDFVIANHFFEHCEDPLSTLTQLIRVLRPGGVLFMCVPDKRYTFDSLRDVTPFDHLVRDCMEGPVWSRETHFREWVRFVEHIADDSAAGHRVKELMTQGYSIHYHVWTLEDLAGLLLRAPAVTGVRYAIECIQLGDGEEVIVLRKPA